MKLLVIALDRCCRLLHWLPGWRCNLSNWSFRLDQKFNIGVWQETKNTMKQTKITLAALLAGISLFTGCKSVTISPALVQQGVATGVSYSVAKYPTAVPYLRLADAVICSAANGTNLSPAEVVADIEAANTNTLKTPEAVLILNGALVLYTGVWDSYGASAVNNAPTLKLYLQATCNGIAQGLPATSLDLRSVPPSPLWPKVRF